VHVFGVFVDSSGENVENLVLIEDKKKYGHPPL
jgi:hypothetical protein